MRRTEEQKVNTISIDLESIMGNRASIGPNTGYVFFRTANGARAKRASGGGGVFQPKLNMYNSTLLKNGAEKWRPTAIRRT